jgi:O-antigen ligase
MRYIARTLVVCLIAFTALAMAIQPSFKSTVVVWVGSFPVSLFDLLLAASTGAFLYAVSLHPATDPCAANRVVLRLTGAYLLYQLFVVAPIAVLAHGVSLGEVLSGLDARLALVLIPFFYYVGLRYLTSTRLIALVNAAALLLLLYALYRYVFIGPQGIWDDNEYRLRVLWGGSTLLFGWLAITGLFLQRTGFRAYAMGLAGILGIVLENHRSGYVALIVALGLYLVSSRRVAKRFVVLACAVLVGALLINAYVPNLRENATYSLSTMFNAHADSNATDRVQRSALAWDYVKKNPLGDYIWNGTFYLVDLGQAGFEPHNVVMQKLDKEGVIGAGLVFALIVLALSIGWRNRARSPVSSVMMAYLVFYAVFCLFNTTFDSIENVTLFAATVALLLHANRMLDERPPAAPSAAEVPAQSSLT